LNEKYEALSVTNTADARQYVESMATMNKDEAYMLAEKSELTPEERVGLYKTRARIERYQYKQKKKLVGILITFNFYII